MLSPTDDDFIKGFISTSNLAQAEIEKDIACDFVAVCNDTKRKYLNTPNTYIEDLLEFIDKMFNMDGNKCIVPMMKRFVFELCGLSLKSHQLTYAKYNQG